MSVFGYLKRKLQKHKERVEEGDTGIIFEGRKNHVKTDIRSDISKGSFKKSIEQKRIKEEGYKVAGKFPFSPRVRKRTKEEGIELAETIYKEQLAKQKKQMLEEAKRKQRAKGRYTGRHVQERKWKHERERFVYRLNKTIDNITLKSAQYIAKTKANAIRVEEEYKKYEDVPKPRRVFYFYDKDNYFVAQYDSEDKELAYVDIQTQKIYQKKKYEREQELIDPEFQPLVKKLIRKRFPDVPSLLSIKVRREIGDELPPYSAGISVPHGQVFETGANIVIGRDKKGPDIKLVLTHELTHERRMSAGEFKPYDTEADKEEVETELETLLRGTIVDYDRGSFVEYGGYWGVLGKNWRIW